MPAALVVPPHSFEVPPVGGHRLTATVEVAWLHANGTLVVPPGTTDLLIEIGANSRNTMDIETLPKKPHSYLVTFEPILDKYASLLARNSHADQKSPLGRHHARGTVLPYAVAAEDGFATFHMSPIDGCSSLMDTSGFSKMGGSCSPNNVNWKEERRVPTVSLNTILSKWLAWEGGGGWPVSQLKIDAQGFDIGIFDTLRGTKLMERIQTVEMETTRDGCILMYNTTGKGAFCSHMIKQMAGYGYKAFWRGQPAQCHRMKFTGAKGCETELTFTRDASI